MDNQAQRQPNRRDRSNLEKANDMRKLTATALRERIPDWGVLVLESHHAPEFIMEWRTHDFLKIVFVLSGSGTFHFSDSSVEFSTNDVVIVPPGMRNRIDDSPESAASLYVCCISPSLMQFDPQLLGRFSSSFHRDSHFAGRCAALMRRMVHAQNRGDKDKPIAMVSAAMELLELVLKLAESSAQALAPKTVTRDRETIKRYIKSLPNEFFDATSIDIAAAGLRMSRRTFTKLFAEEAGETWLQCIRRLAIEHATARLADTDLPIISIAFESGFKDLSTFYRQFKSHVGIPPSAYRKQNRRA